MKSHTCEFNRRDLLWLAGSPLAPLALFTVFLHVGAAKILPPPRPTLDTERTILIHQAESARKTGDAEVLLLGDSSCLMDISARQLSAPLGHPALNLGTFSYLDVNAHALLLREYVQANPGKLRAVVLLMNPESLRRSGSESYYLQVLTNFWAGRDHSRNEIFAGRVSSLLGTDIFKGRLYSRILPVPLDGAYGRRYGFNRDLEDFMIREHGSAVDPEQHPFEGRSEYRLSPALERASHGFRDAVPAGAKLLVGITPLPERFAGPRYPQLQKEMLRQWSQWLRADGVLNDLPPTLNDESFVRTTHLKETVVPFYTEKVAAALQPYLRRRNFE
jgi:hypothetical protein